MEDEKPATEFNELVVAGSSAAGIEALTVLLRREGFTETLTEITAEAIKSGGERYLNLWIAPMQIESGQTDLAVVTVEDVTEQVLTRRRLEAARIEQKQLLKELSAANTLMSDLNKELQAANEELKTNNEELQAANETRETAKSLADEQARLIEMVELAPFDMMILRGPTLVIEAANTRAAGLFGGRETLSLLFTDVFGEPEMAGLVNAVRDAYQRDAVKVTRPIYRQTADERGRSSGRYHVYTVVPTRDSAGQVNGAAIYAEDVTEQRAREAAERREQLKMMVENADQVALGLYDAETAELLQASPRYLEALERAYGISSGQVVGRKWHDLPLIVPREGAVKLFDAAAGGEPSRLPEVRLRLNDNRETVWACSLTPIRFEEDDLTLPAHFVLVSAIEVTEQIRAREEVERINRLKDEFFSLASHELRTPLVPLAGYSEALIRLISQLDGDSDRNRKIAEMAGKFRGQIKHLGRLTDDLLDVARLRSGKLWLDEQPVNPVEVIEQAVEESHLVSPTHTIRFETPAADRPLVVRGDKVRLAQALANLLNNAIKYAPDSNRIDVRLSREQAMAKIEVRDYGPGIAAENLGTIFNRFYQVSTGDGHQSKTGLGLGLFIVKGIVEQHGGAVAVESKVGEGSAFIIRLPLMNQNE